MDAAVCMHLKAKTDLKNRFALCFNPQLCKCLPGSTLPEGLSGKVQGMLTFQCPSSSNEHKKFYFVTDLFEMVAEEQAAVARIVTLESLTKQKSIPCIEKSSVAAHAQIVQGTSVFTLVRKPSLLQKWCAHSGRPQPATLKEVNALWRSLCQNAALLFNAMGFGRSLAPE